MAKLPIRILLFLSSYSPLLVILTFRTFDPFRWQALVVSAIALVSLIVLWMYFHFARSIAIQQIEVECSSSKDAEAMSYIASYIIPFMDLPFDQWRNIVSLLLFF